MRHWKETQATSSLLPATKPHKVQHTAYEVSFVLCIFIICKNCSACKSTDGNIDTAQKNISISLTSQKDH